ncbi:MAG TPA: TQO small subunit DoxD [Acetobacteraceae bacterium]|nr:TQO small subunit DoxD [Acetobacteraceae bacterium]
MSGFTIADGGQAIRTAAASKAEAAWTTAGLALLSVRFIQGFIYWGGGTRRFIYAPSKLNPYAAHWMAYKFQTAMPGALLGTDRLIAYMLHHFWLLYPGVILFSAAELFAGLFLMLGLFTRAAGAVTIGLSFVLMLMFGWQGATCIDEWTMAAANFGIGLGLFLVGGSAYAVDNVLLQRNPALAGKAWFRWACGSLPLPLSAVAFRRLALVLFWTGVAFSVLTYNYYRGSVVTPFHGGPVSPSKHHWGLSDGRLGADGQVSFRAYVDAGTPAEASNLVLARLVSADGRTVEIWTAATLAALPASALHNDFAYQKFHTGAFGIVGPVGAVATIDLPGTPGGASLTPGRYTLRLTSVNGHVWSLPISLQG